MKNRMFSDSKVQITKEISTAVNIKDKTNRKRVISSLKSISQFLKHSLKGSDYVKNGIVIYRSKNPNNSNRLPEILTA